VHGNHVGLPLHKIDPVFLGDGLLGLPNAVQLVILVVNLTRRRVDILLVDTLCPTVEHTGGEAYDLATDTDPREYHATGIAVDQLASVVFITNAGRQQELLSISLRQCRAGEGCSIGQIIAQLELTDDVITKAATAKILHSDGHAVGMLVQYALKILARPLIDDKHRLALALLFLLLIGKLTLLDLDVILVGQPPQRLGIGHLLVLHDEIDGVSALATTKTMTGATGRRDDERGRFLVVERA